MKPVQVHGFMLYECEDCGKIVRMFLEKGLEDKHTKKHKPVPFMIRCPFCNNFHMKDITFDTFIIDGIYHDLPDHEAYFANTKKYDCGKPVFHQGSKYMDRLKDNSDFYQRMFRERG